MISFFLLDHLTPSVRLWNDATVELSVLAGLSGCCLMQAVKVLVSSAFRRGRLDVPPLSLQLWYHCT